MTLAKLLRQTAWLAVVPGLAMGAIALLSSGQPSEISLFSIKYWWITLVLGALFFSLLRSAAWVAQKCGIA